jgi:hypothetical protein
MRLKAYFVVPQPVDFEDDIEELQSGMLQEMQHALPGAKLETELAVLQVVHTRIVRRMRPSLAETLRRRIDYRATRVLEISLVASARRTSPTDQRWPSVLLVAEKRLHEILIAANIASPGSRGRGRANGRRQ